MTHPDMPGGYGEFRVTSWRLNKDFSIDIQGRTTTDSMYDLVAGPKPADVPASPVPIDPLGDSGVPPEPSFGISSRGLGDLIISGVGFPTLNNTRSIFAGTWKILYYDETAAPIGRLASDADPAATVLVVDNASAFTVGKVYAIDREPVKVTARDTTANTITVERVQVGSVAERHPGPKAISGATNATPIMITAINHLRPVNGGDVVEISGVGGNDGANGNWDALVANAADVDTLYLIGASGTGAYTSGGTIAGSRFFEVKEIVVTSTFEPGFFGTAAAGNWQQSVDLPNARIVAVEAYLTNAFGDSPTRLQCYLAGTITRTLLGGQIDLELEGTLAIQSDAVPAFSMPYAAAVWYLFATVQEAPTGGPIRITVRRNGAAWGKSAIVDGQTSAAGAPSGRALGPLSRDERITVDLTGVATTNPGRRLVVSIRL